MGSILFHSTNNPNLRATFGEALLKGQPDDYGLFMFKKEDLPRFGPETLRWMRDKPYPEIAFQVLHPFLKDDIPRDELEELLADAYDPDKISVKLQLVTGKSWLNWLTGGPTYSFKDFAARFFGRSTNHLLVKKRKRRVVVVATSGDTGGAVADALKGLENVDVVVFFPAGEITEAQRRQMTTLGGNVYAFAVNGDFDVCQALAKRILGDKEFAKDVFDDPERFTSANSISVGRLLPQAVYPFAAYSRIAGTGEKMIAGVPSGNFGDMMGTVIARDMGIPISKILVGLNPNKPFLNFMETEVYTVSGSIETPSSAMKVTHPSNLARLIEWYGGRMYDKRDPKTKKVKKQGVISKMPDMDAMRRDFFVHSITNEQHYETIHDVERDYGIILDPHGAVGWRTLEAFLEGKHDKLAVVYETADPGKFPKHVEKAIGRMPEIPEGIQRQAALEERIYTVDSAPTKVRGSDGKEKQVLSDAQIDEAYAKIRDIFV